MKASEKWNLVKPSESLRGLLAILSEDSHLVVGFLGTEPSLFRMPATESRFIDFDERRRELKEAEEIIQKCDKDGGGKQWCLNCSRFAMYFKMVMIAD